MDENYVPTNVVDFQILKDELEESVKEQLASDVPFGLLISGGLDSSLIASITMKLIRKGEVDLKHKRMVRVHSFCIGIEGSPDLFYARQVAEQIGTIHHEYYFTPE